MTLSNAQIPTVSFTARQSHIRYKLYREDAYGGGATFIKEWTGQTGKVEFTDFSVSSDTAYRYSVIPEHPELSVNGKQMTGPVRKSGLIQIKSAEIVLDDIELLDGG